MKLRFISSFCLSCALASAFPTPAAAYFDPGTGSMILQVAAAGVFAGLYFLRRSWAGVKSALRSFLKKS